MNKYFYNNLYINNTLGREDIDVRMLGQGRPFILEIYNPRNVL